ncbi:MAG: GGDEF domain-containing phosphodiesterase [Polyangiaceae bacterium]
MKRLFGDLTEKARDLADGLADTSEETIALIGPEGLIDPAAIYFAREGRPLVDIVGRPVDELIAEALSFVRVADYERLLEAWERLASSPGARDTATFWVRHPEGHMIQLRASAANRLEDRLGAILVRLSVLATKSVNRSLPPLGSDPPPDSLNPESWRGSVMLSAEEFYELLQRHVDAKEERIWNTPSFARSVAKDRRFDYAVVLLDLDRPKLMRAGYDGHVISELPGQIAERLAPALRGRDAIGRLGRTEVAVLLDGVGDVAHTMRATDAFLSLLDEPIEIGDHQVNVVPAVGIATSERRYAKAADLMRDAATAAARALRKQGGRRRRVYETKMRIEDRRRIAIMAALHDGLLRDEVFLLFQPIVSLRDGRLAGFEALARWDHPTLGSISPAEFIPLAEEVGLIRELGRWVIDQAARQLQSWNEIWRGPKPLSVSVNASPYQLADDALVLDVEAVLRRVDLMRGQLKIEITEGAALQDLTATSAIIERLKRSGVSFSLDDFGTGYSSLSYLHQLPYDTVKIDRAFVMEMQEKHEKVLHAIIRLAHALNLEVVAEGLETESQKGALERMSCDYAQGYLLSRPIDVEAATTLVLSDPRW